MSSLLKKQLSPDACRVLNASPYPVWIIDLHFYKILFCNTAALEQLGYSNNELEGRSFLELFAPESSAAFLHRLQEEQAGVRLQGYYKQITRAGERKLVDLHTGFLLLEDTRYCQVTAMPVAETAGLAEEARRFRSYIRESAAGVYCQELRTPVSVQAPLEELVEHCKREAYLVECNDALAAMYGFDSAAEMIGLPSSRLLDLDDPATDEFLAGFIRNGFRVHNAESHEKDRQGRSRYFLNSVVGIVEDGLLIRMWGTQIDITEKKNIEEQNRQLATMVEQTSDVLTIADLDYHPVTWNRAAERVYGLTREEVLGKDIGQLLSVRYNNISRDEIRAIVSRRGEWRGEMIFTRPRDGKQITLLATFKLMQEGGKPQGILISGTEITERIETEARIKESENRFREMADSTPVMVWMSDEDERIIYLNQRWLQFTGEDITGKGGDAWARLVHPDDLPAALGRYKQQASRREPLNSDYRLLTKEGKYRWVKDVAAPRFLDDGSFVGYIGSVVDIEEQKRTENQLRYQALVLENVSDVVVSTDLLFNVTVWNKAAEDYYGILASEAIGHSMRDLVPFHYCNTTREQALADLQENKIWRGEVSVTNRNGQKRYFLQTVKYLFDTNGYAMGFLAIGRDITDRKEMEARLLESEQFYRTLIADSLDATLLLNAEGQISFCSPAIGRVLGYSLEEVLGRNAFEFVHPDDLLWAFESLQREVAENPEVKFIIVRVRRKDGSWIWCMVRGHNLLDNPYVNGIVVYLHDDTLRKQASEELKESESRFRSLIKDLQVGVFIVDNEGTITLCNDALAKMLSVPEEGLIGKQVYQILQHDMLDERELHIPLEQRPLTRARREKEAVKDQVVGVLHPATGDRMWILVNADPVLDVKGEIKHVVCSVMNITERRKLERQLLNDQINHQKQLTQATLDGQEAERREIGKELHDNIGQQLTTIKLFLDMVKSTANDDSLEMVSMALKGVADVINEIRLMSRSLLPHTLKDLGLVESILELVDSVSRSQLLKIEFCFAEFDEELVPENQQLTLFRIIQEQLNNISKHAGAHFVHVSLNTSEGQVSLEIYDDGKGFDFKTVRRGLGFTNIRNRAELFGGSMTLHASPGEGCTLQVTMPAGE